MSEHCLKIRKLSFERHKNGVSFSLLVPKLDLYTGQILAVVGESGCGKSTLSDLIALILRPQYCEEFYLKTAAKNVNLMQASAEVLSEVRGRSIGYVLQSGGLFQFLSVLDNIMLPGKLLGLRVRELRARAELLADKLGISEHLYKKPQFLSGGQRQRVAIARALIHSPRLILADEPTAAVDEYTAQEICEILRKVVADTKTALLLVSHDRNLMRRYADYEVTFELRREQGLVSTLSLPYALRGAGR